MSRCFDDVWRWMCSNRLQLNALKTEFIWCAPVRRRHHIPDAMTMRAHINHVMSSCYGTLRQLRSIKRSLPSHALNTLVTSLVHSRLDYCNVVFAGLPACDVQRLQSIINTATYVWSPAHRDVITCPPCCEIAADFLLSSTSSTSCVRLFIVVCTATHHPTWSTSSSRLLLQVPELV